MLRPFWENHARSGDNHIVNKTLPSIKLAIQKDFESFSRPPPPYEMILIYQPPNAHMRISGILLRNALAAAAAVKKIYCC
jgi:hypothetical protein